MEYTDPMGEETEQERSGGGIGMEVSGLRWQVEIHVLKNKVPSINSIETLNP